MRITITGINFKYDGGFDKEYTGVDLNFITSGFKFSHNQAVQITKEQYEESQNNNDALRTLIVEKILADVNGYVEDLNEYKGSLSE
ncbi:hypothetical protein [Oceanobacillus alkalisoli]|uniref:hypothetical protein n=1 Tax=Oceanobacillus alkalisoli TaxID=2925113 RepID=UPI001F11D4E9|nr:hypothetical protein [Oceanobacillus alkalisoli]MCF3941560.1 hypothetical protein [Oceanobacillus alkalisoli]